MPEFRKFVVSAAIAALVVGGAWLAEPAHAATRSFSFTLKGLSKTTAGEKFKYTGSGSLAFDDQTGAFTYSVELSNGLTFEGDGQGALTSKNELFAVGNSAAGGISGTVLFVGKLKGSKLKGKFTAAIPNRLGPPPAGFVLSTAAINGKEVS